jgi:hypothetical protein
VPELQYYALLSETADAIRALLDEGFRIVPERPVLETPMLDVHERFSSAIDEAMQSYPCALIEGGFTKHPLQFKRRTSGEAVGTYYVDQLSGPRIRWCRPGLNGSELTPGSISYSTSNRDPATNAWEPASEDLKDGYKRVIAIVKRGLERISANTGERVWVGKAAVKAIERGEVRLER